MPLVSLKVAAGAFGAAQSLADEAGHWVQLPEGFAAAPGLFVAQVIGESMNRRIPNGTWCLFRAHPGGSRQGKIVLVQHRSACCCPASGNGDRTASVLNLRSMPWTPA